MQSCRTRQSAGVAGDPFRVRRSVAISRTSAAGPKVAASSTTRTTTKPLPVFVVRGRRSSCTQSGRRPLCRGRRRRCRPPRRRAEASRRLRRPTGRENQLKRLKMWMLCIITVVAWRLAVDQSRANLLACGIVLLFSGILGAIVLLFGARTVEE